MRQDKSSVNISDMRRFSHKCDAIRHNNYMKANGIVRKVDGLGRIVIPREFRKLHKISLGDPMEISCMDNGEIVLKKLDMTLTLEELAFPALEALREASGGTVLVSNTSNWIGGKGELASEYEGKELPDDIKKRLEDRRGFVSDYGTPMRIEPIAGDADVFGALYSAGGGGNASAMRAAAVLLGNALQKF